MWVTTPFLPLKLSEVTILWRYTNAFIIIIIIKMLLKEKEINVIRHLQKLDLQSCSRLSADRLTVPGVPYRDELLSGLNYSNCRRAGCY